MTASTIAKRSSRMTTLARLVPLRVGASIPLIQANTSDD